MQTETESPRHVGSSELVMPDSCGKWQCGQCAIMVTVNDHGEMIGYYEDSIDLLPDLLEGLRDDGVETTPCRKLDDCNWDDCRAAGHNALISDPAP